MTLRGAAAVLFRLVLISALVGNVRKFAFAAGDVCQGRNAHHLAQLLENDEYKMIEGNIENKVLMKQLVRTIQDWKTQNLKQTDDKVDQIAKALGKIADDALGERQERNRQVDKISEAMGKIADALSVIQERQVSEAALEKIADAFNIEKMGEKLEMVLTKALDNTEAAKNAKKCLEIKQFIGSQFFTMHKMVFHYNQTEVSWNNAQEYCQQKGMQLASTKTLSQIEVVARELKNLGYTSHGYWLALNDIGRMAGQFRWADGSPVDSATWCSARSQPNSFVTGKETCAWLHTHYAKLFDEPCLSHWHILCEVPAALSSCFA